MGSGVSDLDRTTLLASSSRQASSSGQFSCTRDIPFRGGCLDVGGIRGAPWPPVRLRRWLWVAARGGSFGSPAATPGALQPSLMKTNSSLRYPRHRCLRPSQAPQKGRLPSASEHQQGGQVSWCARTWEKTMVNIPQRVFRDTQLMQPLDRGTEGKDPPLARRSMMSV